MANVRAWALTKVMARAGTMVGPGKRAMTKVMEIARIRINSGQGQNNVLGLAQGNGVRVRARAMDKVRVMLVTIQCFQQRVYKSDVISMM